MFDFTRNLFSQICTEKIKKAASKAAKKCDLIYYNRIFCVRPLELRQFIVRNVIDGRYKQIVLGCSTSIVGCNQDPN
jgi:hypothetical protein